ncbi:MAG TPA: hypothetical protein VII11_02135 [Bacteroidota bacterium]
MIQTLNFNQQTDIAASAIPSYFKGLLLYNSSEPLLSQGHIVPSVIDAYNALLQLGISMFLWDIRRWEELKDESKVMARAIEKVIKSKDNPRRDPAQEITHKTVGDFLELREKSHSFLKPFSQAFSNLKSMRNFVHYAPRFRKEKTFFLFDTCEYTPSQLKSYLQEYINQKDLYFDLYYKFIQSIDRNQPIFLHFKEHEELFLYSSNGLAPYYCTHTQRDARLQHIKTIKYVPVKMRNCLCSNVKA